MNAVHRLAMTLHLSDGSQCEVHHPERNLDAIRERFGEVLDREYFIDYPDRKAADLPSKQP